MPVGRIDPGQTIVAVTMEQRLQYFERQSLIKLLFIMKKFLLFLAGTAMVVAVNAAPQKVDFDKLPKNSQEFIQKNFPKETVKLVEMDREASWDKYTVFFDSGTQVSFEGGSGDCSQIVMKNGTVPAMLVPAKIKAYVADNYPDRRIVMMKTTADGINVGLSDKTLLDFNEEGDFTQATK